MKQIQVEIIQNFLIPDNYTLENGVLKDEVGNEIKLAILPLHLEDYKNLKTVKSGEDVLVTTLPIIDSLKVVLGAYPIEEDMESQ